MATAVGDTPRALPGVRELLPSLQLFPEVVPRRTGKGDGKELVTFEQMWRKEDAEDIPAKSGHILKGPE